METQVDQLKDEEIVALIIKYKETLDRRAAQRQKEEERLRQLMLSSMGSGGGKKRGRKASNAAV
jgi:hypothetical protein